MGESERKLSRERMETRDREQREGSGVGGRIWTNQSSKEPFPKSTRCHVPLPTTEEATPYLRSSMAHEAAQLHVFQGAVLESQIPAPLLSMGPSLNSGCFIHLPGFQWVSVSSHREASTMGPGHGSQPWSSPHP